MRPVPSAGSFRGEAELKRPNSASATAEAAKTSHSSRLGDQTVHSAPGQLCISSQGCVRSSTGLCGLPSGGNAGAFSAAALHSRLSTAAARTSPARLTHSDPALLTTICMVLRLSGYCCLHKRPAVGVMLAQCHRSLACTTKPAVMQVHQARGLCSTPGWNAAILQREGAPVAAACEPAHEAVFCQEVVPNTTAHLAHSFWSRLGAHGAEQGTVRLL